MTFASETQMRQVSGASTEGQHPNDAAEHGAKGAGSGLNLLEIMSDPQGGKSRSAGESKPETTPKPVDGATEKIFGTPMIQGLNPEEQGKAIKALDATDPSKEPGKTDKKGMSGADSKEQSAAGHSSNHETANPSAEPLNPSPAAGDHSRR